MTTYAGLAARIDLALAEADLLVPRIQVLVERARRDDDFAVIDALALNLQSLYTGIEQVFEGIAREVDGAMPEGPNWHRDLLAQMAGSTGAGRSAVLTAGSFACLDGLRSFRHVVRNVYAYRLDPRRVTDLAVEVLGCYAVVRTELRAFGAILAGAE